MHVENAYWLRVGDISIPIKDIRSIRIDEVPPDDLEVLAVCFGILGLGLLTAIVLGIFLGIPLGPIIGFSAWVVIGALVLINGVRERAEYMKAPKSNVVVSTNTSDHTIARKVTRIDAEKTRIEIEGYVSKFAVKSNGEQDEDGKASPAIS